MPRARVFISHVSEEADLAEIVKAHLSNDFLNLLDIFVSSDAVSITAGTNWLSELETALQKSESLLVLCSHASLNRSWVNFEVGAAWIQKKPIVPICHSGLSPHDLPIPLSLLQGVQANTEAGLQRVYFLIAELLHCKPPNRELNQLRKEVESFEKDYAPKLATAFATKTKQHAAAKERIYTALKDPSHEWRTIERLAVLGGITEDEVLELLVQDPIVKLGKRQRDGKRMAQFKPQEG